MAMFTVLPWIILNYMAEFVLKKKKASKALKHVIMNLATTKYVVYCGECIGHMARHLEARRNVDINHFYITKLGQKNLTSKLNFN